MTKSISGTLIIDDARGKDYRYIEPELVPKYRFCGKKQAIGPVCVCCIGCLLVHLVTLQCLLRSTVVDIVWG